MPRKSSANQKTAEVELQMESYRQNHQQWKMGNLEHRTGFFPIFNDFKLTHLTKISGGALKAYVYFGLHANNATGECWHSSEKMSEFFEVDLRTMKKWISELEELGLIARIQVGFKRVANTFILPYEIPKEVPQVETENIVKPLKRKKMRKPTSID